MALTKVRGAGAEGLTLSSTDGTVASGDLLFGTANKGVVLGATSNTDANTLSDYEEGQWTISFPMSTSGSYTVRSGYAGAYYTKLGNLVTIFARFETQGESSPSAPLPVTLVKAIFIYLMRKGCHPMCLYPKQLLV